MGHIIYRFLTRLFARYGYGAVFAGVMLENAGVPVPGETVLLFGGFLAHQGTLGLKAVIGFAIAGAIVGDNLGYWIGRSGGVKLLRRLRGRAFLSERIFDKAENAVLRYGAWAVFAARFVMGLRIVAGPLAGGFRMRYRNFLLANACGAVLWGTTIGVAGYLLGSSWDRLVYFARDVDLAALIAATVVALILVARALLGRRRARPAR
ncbi:MAG TPA: DedA family protein [Terriglobia bacterium]|nr:DedA family protein [Terriglobia bacterium]